MNRSAARKTLAHVVEKKDKTVQIISLIQHTALTKIGIFSKTQMVMRDASAVSGGRLGSLAGETGLGAQTKKILHKPIRRCRPSTLLVKLSKLFYKSYEPSSNDN